MIKIDWLSIEVFYVEITSDSVKKHISNIHHFNIMKIHHNPSQGSISSNIHPQGGDSSLET